MNDARARICHRIKWRVHIRMTQANSSDSRLATYRNWQRMATAQTGKSALQQCREILALKKLGGQCGISDYYWYKLYDSDYLHGRGIEDFLGWRLQAELSLALNPGTLYYQPGTKLYSWRWQTRSDYQLFPP